MTIYPTSAFYKTAGRDVIVKFVTEKAQVETVFDATVVEHSQTAQRLSASTRDNHASAAAMADAVDE